MHSLNKINSDLSNNNIIRVKDTDIQRNMIKRIYNFKEWESIVGSAWTVVVVVVVCVIQFTDFIPAVL